MVEKRCGMKKDKKPNHKVLKVFAGICCIFFGLPLMLASILSQDKRAWIYIFIWLPLVASGIALIIIGKRNSQQQQPPSSLQRLVNDEKTEQTSDVYILDQEDHVTGRADGKPISEKEIPYLIEQGLDSARTYYDNSPNPKFHRSEQEFELSYRFECNHGTESQKKIDAFTDHAKFALEAVNIDEKIRLLEETIDLFYKARDWHYKKSKGGMIYFQDMWEHLHNSRNPDFSWVDPEKETLKSAILERDEIEPWILQHADPGFMQPEIYRAFPSVEQATLRKSIDRLVNLGGLNKEKIGRSYRITTASVASAIVDQ